MHKIWLKHPEEFTKMVGKLLELKKSFKTCVLKGNLDWHYIVLVNDQDLDMAQDLERKIIYETL